MKNGFEQSKIYRFSFRIRIRIQDWTKTTPKPDFYRLLKNYSIYKRYFLLIFIGAAASAGGPFQYQKLGGAFWRAAAFLRFTWKLSLFEKGPQGPSRRPFQKGPFLLHL